MPKLFEITEEWSPQPWYSTGGTRAKKYLQSPDGEYYYFKRSQYKDPTAKKPGKDFKYEFWSEVIAYEVGTLLGFNVLRYDIATDGEIMGCISQSMINSEEEVLVEGVKYLQAFSWDYNPALKEHRTWYTFQLIRSSLKNAGFDKSVIHQIIEIIMFDALIGNGDRHQENWAIINRQQWLPGYLEALKRQDFKALNKIRLDIKTFKKSKFIKSDINRSGGRIPRKKKKLQKDGFVNDARLSPIYDSGSSLGRELVKDKVEFYLSSETELKKYIERGPSEIHWNGEKISHFELIQNLLDSKYKKVVKGIWTRISEKWNNEEIENRIRKIDELVPESHKGYKIPEPRKELIINLIKLRKDRLEELLHE